MKDKPTIEPMRPEDFLRLMEMNQGFYPEYASLSQQDKLRVAQLNRDTGIAESHYLDGKLVAVTGIRERGIGEAWFVTTPDIRENHKFLLFKSVKENLPIYRDTLNLWKLFATSRISETFLKHLGFDCSEDRQNIFQWIRSK
jgi:hypothetical protein